MELFDILTSKTDVVGEILDIPDTWTPITSVVLPENEAVVGGLYFLGFTLGAKFGDITDSTEFRYRVNTGDWISFSKEPKDKLDVIPFSFDIPYRHDLSSDITLEVEAEKSGGNKQLDLIAVASWAKRVK